MSYIAESVQRAKQLGRSPEAVAAWRELLGQAHVDEADYSEWASALAHLYVQVGRGMAAARIHEYLLNINPAVDLYSREGTPRDEARVLRFGRRLREASTKYREASLFGHAAVASEEEGDLEEALSLFEQLARSYEAQASLYLQGLAALNAGRLAMRLSQRDRAIAHLALATRCIEQEADREEQEGHAEQAFRCYLCLCEIGRIEDSYENLAEGFLNCIRLLKAKSDRFGTMSHYYDFIVHSEELGELHSVAELYREAGEYAKRVGFIYADFFLAEAGAAWLRVADSGLENGNPTELVENAMLAAVACYNRIRDNASVAECYERLTTLPVSEQKAARYAELAQELRDEARVDKHTPPPAFPEYFRRQRKPLEIWIRDLLAAEGGNEIPDAIGRLVGDRSNVSEVQRRKALLISLGYDDHIYRGGEPNEVPAKLIEKIGELQHADAVKPLVAFFEAGSEDTKVVILDRGTNVREREVFALIDRALESDSPRVKQSGIGALRRVAFSPALDSLVRIFNSHPDEDVRDACLKSIADIGTDEACEFLLDVVRSNSGNLGIKTRMLLEKSAQERMLSALERNRRSEPDPNLRLFIGRLVDNIRSRRGTLSY